LLAAILGLGQPSPWNSAYPAVRYALRIQNGDLVFSTRQLLTATKWSIGFQIHESKNQPPEKLSDAINNGSMWMALLIKRWQLLILNRTGPAIGSNDLYIAQAKTVPGASPKIWTKVIAIFRKICGLSPDEILLLQQQPGRRPA